MHRVYNAIPRKLRVALKNAIKIERINWIMSANHMNLKRISHRIKEEFESTIEVAKVVGIKGAFATFRGKVDIQIMVHNGHIEYPRIKST